MLRKLFCWLAESMHAPYLPSPAEEVPEEPRDVDVIVMDTWKSLPADVLLEIFLYLEPAAVFCCAGVCKPWRRAIVDNASILGFHLLLGVFHNSRYAACLRRTPPGPFQSVLPWKDSGGDDKTAAAHSLIPAWSGSGGVYRGLYRELLCSRDGFILLMARSGRHYRNRSLCLCNPITGDCTFLRPADTGRRSSYVLLTGYGHGDDLSPSGSAGTGYDLEARILAVQTRARYDNLEFVFKFKAAEALRYQVFAASGDGDGKWGPVKRSVGEVEEGLFVWMRGRSTVVCRDDVVHWLAGPAPNITCVLALDVRTGRTRTTELPKQCHFCIRSPAELILATSDDGRLSLIQSFWGPKIKVWVLIGDAGWTLQQTIAIGGWRQPITGDIPRWISLSAFCPRSRCVVGASLESKQEFLIDLGSGSGPPVTCIGNYKGLDCWPYEIDSSSTYISIRM
jgi:hypothetical protein